jgi:hypothetical protein
MARFTPSPRVSIDMQRDVIDVTSNHYTADPDWRHTDRQGHEHRYERGYPTLDLIVDASHWCMGNEGLYAHDQHEAVDESHYECLLCRETIEPGLLPPGYPQTIAGLIVATATAVLDDGRKVTVHLTSDEIEQVWSRMGDSSTAEEWTLRMIADMSEDRWIGVEFNG